MKTSAAGGAPEDVGVEMEAIGPLRATADGRLAFGAGVARLELWVMEGVSPPVSTAKASKTANR